MNTTRTPLPPLPEREEIALLEPFEGLGLNDIVLVATRDDAERAAAALLAAGVVGFDTESKPTFAKNEVSTGPHLVQFATRETAWLFQLHRSDCNEVLGALIGSEALRKVGFGLSSDLSLIRQKLKVEPRAVYDIDDEFRRRGYRRSVGVKTAVALVFGQRFTKSRKATTSNWASHRLSEAQLRYAANDAYASIRVFDALLPRD
ncbi:3'-5' exonuclease [Variovorax paradoxus]|uniref:3'-5' exonuclease n=1 Tax=Variovorax TaxID=34072 RepID=UPI0006E5E641|nr:3'-5' exonuclease [Variovorax sp. CY25R-8]KPU92664.1 3'-5' exonuclease [Variovorax paradoxus]KPV06222.1 3'-5' exonuclease [Variovorax paradoxus]KPV07124.1 3'-5' exonuclease [Variovorax paradoxus]KPV09353.1 3'-5' exonuclease [Variovorax paradoxus]KPV28246.1 3'-5' exonuclease [Variovorax paradoxus]